MCRYEFRPPLAGIFAHPDLVWPEYWTRKRISGGGGRHAISELRIPLFSSQLNSQLSVIIAFIEFCVQSHNLIQRLWLVSGWQFLSGLHFEIPCVEHAEVVDMRTCFMKVPPQEVLYNNINNNNSSSTLTRIPGQACHQNMLSLHICTFVSHRSLGYFDDGYWFLSQPA